MAITVKNVNKAIAKEMTGIELVKGEGYFYFVGEQVFDPQGSVYVNSIGQLTVSQWIEEAKERWVSK